MNNKYNERVQPQYFTQPASFRPLQAPDVASGMEREFGRYQQRMRPYEQSLLDQDQINIANAQLQGEELKQKSAFLQEASAFSKRALDMWLDIEEQSAKDREIGETYEVLMNGFDERQPKRQAEEEAVVVGEAQAPIVSKMAEQAESQFGIEAAQVVREKHGRLAAGVNGEKALLIQARADYSPWLTQYLSSNATIDFNGQKIRVVDAVNSTNAALRQAAMKQGRFQFIRERGLQYATKTNVVKFLSQQMMTAESSIGSGLATQSIKAERESNKQRIQGLAYAAAKAGNSVDAQSLYNEMSQQARNSNTGLTLGAASDLAISSMIEGFKEAGNTTALEAMKTVQKVPGQAGTELSKTHLREIDEAIAEAKEVNATADKAIGQQIENQMYEQLSGVQNTAQRIAIVEQSASDMERAGLWKKARKLREDMKSLQTVGGAEVNEAKYEQAIRDGEITTVEQLNQIRDKGLLTPEAYKRRLTQLNSINDPKEPKDKSVGNISKAYYNRFRDNFLVDAKLRKDPLTGELTLIPGQEALLTPGDARVINQAVEAEMNVVANTAARQNAHLPAEQRDQAVREALQGWYKDNVLTQGGKYYLDAGDGVTGFDDKQKKYWRDLANSPVKLSTYTPGRTFTSSAAPRDLTEDLSPGVAPTAEVKNKFNPIRGDRVLSQVEVKTFAEQFSKGIVDPDLALLAQGLGMTPLALLNQQISAYPDLGIKPVNPPTDDRPINTGLQAAQFLMSRDIPANSAAMLAGNVEAESAMRGQRPYWVLDDGAGKNGGLLSWNRSRLSAIESHFGKPVQQISNAEQLDYMLLEMQQKYKYSWRILKNPYATERQLRDAMRVYIGWGEEGDRFQNAARIQSQL